MDKSSFKAIVDSWISFHGKKFASDDYSSEDKSYKRHLKIYYDVVSYMSAQELDRGFRESVKIHKYYPKPAELLKFCPAEKRPDNSPSYKPLPMSPEAKEKINSVLKGTCKFQLGEEQIRANFSLIARRWPDTDWDSALNRELAIDSKRMPI